METLKKQDKSRVDEILSLKKAVFHSTESIPWEELTPDLWSNGLEDLRQPGEGNTSRPFFVMLRRPGKANGLAVVKFMRRGSSASYYFGDRILKQLGARTPGFRFLQPANAKDQPELEALGRSVRERVESDLVFGGGAVLDVKAWTLTNGQFTVFGQTFELLIMSKGGRKTFSGKEELLEFLLSKGSPLLSTCTMTLDESSGKILCDKRKGMADEERAYYDGSVGWFQRMKELTEGTCEAIMVFEYVKGKRLDEKLRNGMLPTQAEEHGTPANPLEIDDAMANVYQKIGEMLVGDLLLNNWDRFRLPYVWDGGGNAGNVLLTDDWQLISIDHEIDDHEVSAKGVVIGPRNFPVINDKIEKFLANVQGADSSSESLDLPQLSELLQALLKDPYDEDAPPPNLPLGALHGVLRGVVRGVFLVANFPRLWYPNSPPGLFEYLGEWKQGLEADYPRLAKVSDDAWSALFDRVQHVHQRAYPMLLLNDTLHVHDILHELLEPSVRPDLIAGHRAPQLELVVGEQASSSARLASRFIRRLRKQPSGGGAGSIATQPVAAAQRLRYRLGPFDLEPLGPVECASFATEDVDDPSGGSYSFGVIGATSGVAVLSGRLSKAAAIKLDPSAKETASVPSSAKKFAFVYPSSSEIPDAGNFADVALCFLRVGGYVYWDATGEVCGLRALKPGLGIHFSHPRLLQSHPGVRKALFNQGRVFPPTVAKLIECGVTGFAWIAPGEIVGGHEDGKMLWKDGAFAYFFPSAAQEFDCFYSVTAFVAPRLGGRLGRVGDLSAAAVAAEEDRPEAFNSMSEVSQSTLTSAKSATVSGAAPTNEQIQSILQATLRKELTTFAAQLDAKFDAKVASAVANAYTAAAPTSWHMHMLAAAAMGAIVAVVAGVFIQ